MKKRIGKYEIIRRIGRGGMASIFLARQTGRLSREVAIKFLAHDLAVDEDFVKRFEREAQLASNLQHRNLVTIHDFDRED